MPDSGKNYDIFPPIMTTRCPSTDSFTAVQPTTIWTNDNEKGNIHEHTNL